jgi:hypothetical protein
MIMKEDLRAINKEHFELLEKHEVRDAWSAHAFKCLLVAVIFFGSMPLWNHSDVKEHLSNERNSRIQHLIDARWTRAQAEEFIK